MTEKLKKFARNLKNCSEVSVKFWFSFGQVGRNFSYKFYSILWIFFFRFTVHFPWISSKYFRVKKYSSITHGLKIFLIISWNFAKISPENYQCPQNLLKTEISPRFSPKILSIMRIYWKLTHSNSETVFVKHLKNFQKCEQ